MEKDARLGWQRISYEHTYCSRMERSQGKDESAIGIGIAEARDATEGVGGEGADDARRAYDP